MGFSLFSDTPIRHKHRIRGQIRRACLLDCGPSDIIWLVTGTMEFYEFYHSVENVIIPTVTHSIIFQRGRLNHQPDNN